MKLPPIQQGNVQSLGRLSPNLPLSAAQARTNALLEIGAAADSWGNADDDAKADLAASQAAIAEAKLRQSLVSQNVHRAPDGTEAPMYEVMDKLYDEGIEKIRKEYGEGLSKKGQVKFQTKFNGRVATGSQEVAKTSFDKQIDAYHGAAITSWEQYVTLGLEEQAIETLNVALANGVMEYAEHQERLIETGQRIDKQLITDRMMNLTSDEEAEALERILQTNNFEGRPSRLPLEERQAMLSQLDRRTKAFDERRTELHEQTTGELFGAHMRGELRSRDIRAALASDQISYQQAMTLEAKLREEPAPLGRSSPAAVESFRRRIVNLRFMPPGSDGMTAELNSVVNEIRAHMNGMYPDGRPTATTLTGEDADKLISDAEKEYGQAFNNPTYKNAMETLRKSTSVDGLVDLSKNRNNVMAFLDFKRALDAEYDQRGYGFDAAQWAYENAGRFDPALYKGKSTEADRSMSRLETHYRVPPTVLGVDPNADPTKPGTGAKYPLFDPRKVKQWALNQARAGVISDEEYEQIINEVNTGGGLTVDDYMQFEAMTSDQR